ncbi:MAG: Gfo/Idh/MocA family oxidoreductase [Chloroflexota bacterium]|nr:Gfo/Idh/MocA family oxidoreductase [Chloroflexota bacterium]
MTHRALVLGAGNAGRAHAEALTSIGVDVVGPISGTATVTDLAPLRDPAVDVVHVATANDLHEPLVHEALLAGKHVVCEKPLAGNLDGAEKLVESAERSGLQSTICQNYRFLPLIAELGWRVAAGELGPVHLARGAYLQDWLLLPTDGDWRLDPARGGAARTASDIGVHWLDLVETITGRQVEAVVAQLGYLHGRTTEDHAGLLIRFSGGVQGICTLSQAAAGHRNDLELSFDGTTGSATWLSARRDELWIGTRGRAPEVVTRSGLRSRPAQALADHPRSFDEGRRNLLAAFYGTLDGRPSPLPLPTFADGLRHVRFAEAAMRSATRGAWVEVADMKSAAVHHAS